MYLLTFILFSSTVKAVFLDPPYGLQKANWDSNPWTAQDLEKVQHTLTYKKIDAGAPFVCFCSLEQIGEFKKQFLKSFSPFVHFPLSLQAFSFFSLFS